METTLLYFALGLAIIGFIFTLYYEYREHSEEKLILSWFEDKDKLELYNRFIEYMRTDFYTGLKTCTEPQMINITCPSDYLQLDIDEKIIVKATVLIIIRHGKDDNYKALREMIEEALEVAEEIRKLRGF